MNRHAYWGCVVIPLTVSPPAFAAATCTLSVTAPENFGNYNPLKTTDTTTTGSVNVTCASYSGTYTIALNAGTSGTVADRKMANGGQRLDYQLYQDPGRTIIWGNGNSGSQKLSGSCSVTCNATYPVYGDITALQEIPQGIYTSSVTATLTY